MDDQTPVPFSIDAWQTAGFAGFTPLLSLDAAKVPARPGVYAVLRPSVTEAVFEPTSCGGWFKGKDPSVPASICWTSVTDGDPGAEESRLIDDFRERFGARPFANLRD